jgi:hypothetical protein
MGVRTGNVNSGACSFNGREETGQEGGRRANAFNIGLTASTGSKSSDSGLELKRTQVNYRTLTDSEGN